MKEKKFNPKKHKEHRRKRPENSVAQQRVSYMEVTRHSRAGVAYKKFKSIIKTINETNNTKRKIK